MENLENIEDYPSTSKDILKDSPDSPDECLDSSDKHILETKEIKFEVELDLSTENSYIMWENDNANICWLDASMALLVHNQTMRQVIKLNPDCQVSKIIKSYDEAISTLNNFTSDETTDERLKVAKDILLKVQESSLKYLQPLVKCKKGEPDSAFCSLLNLIKEDKLIQGFFDVTYMWVKFCNNCEMQRVLKSTKPIITINNVEKFVPENHISPCQCHMCKKKDQTVKLLYKKLPACLIFHFENGAGNGNVLPLEFSVASREYHLTGVMMLEKAQESNVNHFVTYIRDPSVNKWLECNDLNIEIVSFIETQPELDLKDVYIYMYETFDDLGTIEIEEDPSLSSSNHNIPCIDLSDEDDAKKLKSPEKNKDLGPKGNDWSETVENIKAFLSSSLEEDSNSNSKTSEVNPKNFDQTKSISNSDVNKENLVSVPENDDCISSLNYNRSKSSSVSKSAEKAITDKADSDDSMIQKNKVKTPIDGYFNIHKFIEYKLNEIKATPKLGSVLSIGRNTSLYKKDSSNSSCVSVKKSGKSSKLCELLTDNMRVADGQTEKREKVEVTKKKLPKVKKLKKKNPAAFDFEVASGKVPIDQTIIIKHDENNVISALDSKQKSSNMENPSKKKEEEQQMTDQKLNIECEEKSEVTTADPEKSSEINLQNFTVKAEKLEAAEEIEVKAQVKPTPIVKAGSSLKEKEFFMKPKKSKHLSKEIQSKQTCNINVNNSLCDIVSNASNSIKDSQSSKQIFLRLKECTKEELAKQLKAKGVSKKISLSSSKVLKNNSSKEETNVSKNILDKSILGTDNLLGILEDVMNDSETSNLQKSSQNKTTNGKNRPMMHHISVDSSSIDDQTSFNMNQPSCSYSNPSVTKVFKPKKNKGFHVQFSNEMNDELKNHKIVKKLKSKGSKYTTSSVTDTNTPSQENISGILNSNRSPNKSPKSLKGKKTLKVKMFPQFSRPNQAGEDSDKSLDPITDSIFSDDFLSDSGPPKKKIKEERFSKTLSEPNSSFSENSANKYVGNINSNSCNSMCSNSNCQCYKIEKTKYLDGAVDHFLMQLFQSYL